MSASCGDADEEPRCDRCASRRGVEAVTVTDDSGGSAIALCADCRDTARASRCGLCGGLATARRACAVLLDDVAVTVCVGCRASLLRRGRCSA